MQLATTRWSNRRGWSTPLPEWDGESTLVLVFGDAALLDDAGLPSEAGAPASPLAQVRAAYPTSVVVGCSTAGQIMGTELSDATLTVSVTRFERTRLALEVAPVTKESSHAVGQRLGERLHGGGDDLAAVFVLSDGLSVNGSSLADGLAAGAGGHAVITGGLAGDGDRFERTWVLVDGAPTPSHVTAVGLYGTEVEVSFASEGGWTILGPQRVVTRSIDNVLYELDGQPALSLYKTYLGDRVSGLPGTALLFPLQVWATDQGGREVVRTILAVDEDEQSMTFAGDVPKGAIAQLMRATTDQLVDAAQEAAVGAAAGLPGGPAGGAALAVAVSCVGRRLLLGRRTEDELEAVEAGLGAADHLVGFYSYGELSPMSAGGCDLHNQTMTLTVFRERSS